jgi:hypothetical protein
MFYTICLWARRLDEWLQERLGRPYNFILGVGLVTEIIQQIANLGPKLVSAPTVVRTVLVLAVELALLLHQIGALTHHIERRRTGRDRRGKATASE